MGKTGTKHFITALLQATKLKICVTKNKDKKMLETRVRFKALFNLTYKRKNSEVLKGILSGFLHTKSIQC